MCCLIFYVKDEDPKNAWLYLHENDIVAILNQLQMAEVFKHVLLMTSNPDGNMWFRNIFYIKLNICIFWQCEKHLDCLTGSPRYDCHQTSEPLFLKLLAFCTCFVDILGCGLQTYNLPRYKQLNKRIGRMIRYPTKPSLSANRERINLMHISKHYWLQSVCVVHSKKSFFFFIEWLYSMCRTTGRISWSWTREGCLRNSLVGYSWSTTASSRDVQTPFCLQKSRP